MSQIMKIIDERERKKTKQKTNKQKKIADRKMQRSGEVIVKVCER